MEFRIGREARRAFTAVVIAAVLTGLATGTSELPQQNATKTPPRTTPEASMPNDLPILKPCFPTRLARK
ncbi:MAG: hypothetical protein ABH816_02015 [Candidatus Levyibacteriota bacterium]